MTQIQFEQRSPAGIATLDTGQLVISTDGALFVRSGDGLVPLGEEGRAALEDRFGDTVEDALHAARAPFTPNSQKPPQL